MADAIILAAVAVILCFAVKGTLRHFKGEGPCCGGGSGSGAGTKKKRLENPVTGKKTVHILGMHCERCVRSVTEAINAIDGASAKVSLKTEQAVVSCDREVADAAICEAVERAGFRVGSIEE